MSTITMDPEPLEHLEVPADLLELYEVLEYVGHEDVMRTFVQPTMASPLMAISLPPNFISRQQWGARSWTSRTSILKTARGNTGHYEGPEMGQYDHSTCAAKVRGIQSFHMAKGWADIAYSDIICRHGCIYEGRGYGYRTAANGTNAGNDQSYAHCVMIGVNDAFPQDAKVGLKSAWEWYESRGSGDIRKTHDQWKATACPGGPVRDFILRDNLWLPTTPPPPTPTPGPVLTLIDEVEIDMNLQTFSVSIGTTPSGQPNAGCGWVRVPYERKQIKGFTPPGIRPEVDGRYETAEVGMADDTHVFNPGTVISVEGWTPGFAAVLEITVAVP